MRRKGRIDGNQERIVTALRDGGASVWITSSLGKGAPDLVAGYKKRNYLIEIKDGDQPMSRRKLTPDEVTFHDNWRGQIAVVENVEEALLVVFGMG